MRSREKKKLRFDCSQQKLWVSSLKDCNELKTFRLCVLLDLVTYKNRFIMFIFIFYESWRKLFTCRERELTPGQPVGDKAGQIKGKNRQGKENTTKI